MSKVESLAEDLTSSVSGIDFAGRQIMGTREGQEDSYGVIPPNELGDDNNNLLVIVADGMGGHAAGEVASTIAVDVFADQFLNSPHDIDPARLWDALEAANKRIGEKIDSSSGELKGMGTTMLSVLIRGYSMRWISIGDSPLYIYRSEKIEQLNEVHTYAKSLDELAKEGVISEEEAKSDSERNVLNAALIGDELYHVDDSDLFELIPGDVIIAATDGINTLSDKEIAESIKSIINEGAEVIAENILNHVKSQKKARQDNATVVVIEVG